MPKQLSADIDLHGRKRVRPTTTANDKLALIAYALHSVCSIFSSLFRHLVFVFLARLRL